MVELRDSKQEESSASAPPHTLPDDWDWIDTSAALLAWVERLRAAPRFAIDTEANSMHAYRERVCLVQISLPDHDALIDPLAVDIRPLGGLLADPGIEKVMHGADYDILCFKREYGFEIANLFDTMLAARVLGWGSYGLGPILAERFGFMANKKMQRFDWGQRPLPVHALEYARWDTRFLFSLQAEQLESLRAMEREDELRHACVRQTQVEPRPRKAEVLGMWSLKGARQLSGPGRARLHALYGLREVVAERIDRPVFRVMSDAILLSLARRPPEQARKLADIRGLHPSLRRAEGRTRLWAAIQSADEAEPPVPPAPASPIEPEQVARFDALRGWRKTVAISKGIEPDIVVSKGSLMTIAAANPQSMEALVSCGAFDAWELERYATQVLEAIGN